MDFLYLSEPDMIKAGVEDMKECVDVMEDLLITLYKGDYVMGGENHNSHGCMITFPDDPKFPGMPKNADDRRFMAMPAYLGGRYQMAGMKWYGSQYGSGLRHRGKRRKSFYRRDCIKAEGVEVRGRQVLFRSEVPPGEKYPSRRAVNSGCGQHGP